MNIKVIVATLGGGVVFLLLGWLIFGVALFDFFRANTAVKFPGLMKDFPDPIPLILMHLGWAWLVAFVFDYWAGIRTLLTGMKGGALITFGVILVSSMQFAAFMDYYAGIVPILVDILVATAIGAIGGGVIGWILGRMSSAE